MTLLLLALYGAAAVAYGLHFARRSPVTGQTATTLLMLAAVVHTFAVATQTVEVGHVPIANPSRFVFTFVWLLSLSYLYLEVATNERAMGAFVLPVIFALQLIPTIDPGVDQSEPVLDSAWFSVHVASLLFAYASFALAGVLGLTYVLQFKEIKKKQLGYFYTRLPSLQVLDAMNSRAVAIGWLCLTIGVVVGAIWTTQARAAFPGDPNLEAISLADPKVFVSVVAWAVYAFAVLSRRTLGWSGRRAAWLSASGFAIVVLNFIAVRYLVSTSHNFG